MKCFGVYIIAYFAVVGKHLLAFILSTEGCTALAEQDIGERLKFAGRI
ncbi:MAG: hypothetical protein J6Q67_03875 [Clostridia bacterium]|nr:hypothetical protein [Clostridia bacterium]